MVKMFRKVFCVLVLVQCVLSQLDDESESEDGLNVIGGIFYNDELEDLEPALTLSAEEFNFSASVKSIPRGASLLTIQKHVCDLAQEKVIGIIDGVGGRATEHIQAISDKLDLPHVIVQPNDLYARNWSLLSLYPSPDGYNEMLTKLVELKDWNNFTILYEKGYSLRNVEKLMRMGNYSDQVTVSVRELSGDDYRYVLINTKEKGYFNFVVDCPSSKLEQLLTHAQQVGLMADEHSYIFLSPDLFTLDLSRFRYGGVNMTGFRLVDLKKTYASVLWNFTANFNLKTGKTLNAEDLKTKVVLIYDAVKMFSEAVKKIRQIEPEALNCYEDQSWAYGSSLSNFMKTNKVTGITRTMIFDGLGQRNDVTFDILELTPSGNQTIGQWTAGKLEMQRPYMPPPELTDEAVMKNKTFKVLIALTEPYAYLKKTTTKLEGNDQYEGYAVELIDELSKILGFNYEFIVEKTYGGFNTTTQKGTGMVQKLRDDEADFAICDLTITVDRQHGIDFSTPFMTLGIGILYKEPSKQPPEMFSFMAVFTREVWLYMVFVQMCIGVIMIFVGRISNKEWQNPVPCIEQPEELNNQFSFANSIWLIIGSVMQQGSEIAPIALGPRLITSVWWFFTMVMVASYVGTLVAFLTVEKNVLPFTNAQELYDKKSIQYGCKESGSTRSFFENPTSELYRKMHQAMIDNKWFVADNDKGVEKAEKENYAFFTESTAIDFYRERHCDLLQIGELLDSKSYGIGMKHNSNYKKYIDDALLKLKESGKLQRIKDYWWKEDRGGGQCGEKKEESAKQLSMKNMIGAFVVLYVGCCFGLLISVLDMLWGVFKRSVKYNTTFKYELVEELKFALTFSGDVKPVKRPGKSDEGSGEALADADAAVKEEAKDELGSLRSAWTGRSGRSTSSRRSCHSHCSRHSSSELSVAFARRREYQK